MSDVWGADAAPAQVVVKVNGEVVGSVAGTATLGSVASEYSQSHGLRTFNVLVNGSKAETSQGGATLSSLGATSVELVAKEARGSR